MTTPDPPRNVHTTSLYWREPGGYYREMMNVPLLLQVQVAIEHALRTAGFEVRWENDAP